MIYAGHDVLLLDYHRGGAVDERLQRRFTVLDNKTGRQSIDETSAAPAAVQPFTWMAFGRAEMAALRAFLDARVGRAVPFWLPSLQWDLRLAVPAPAAEANLAIAWTRYCRDRWGTTGARRHLALWRLGQLQPDCYRVAAASDPDDGLSEILTLDPVTVRRYEVEDTVVSFLKLCRLESDEVEISYPSPQVAEATIRAVELPLEAPL